MKYIGAVDPRDIATFNTTRSAFRKAEKIFASSASTPAGKAKLTSIRARNNAFLEQLAQRIGLKPNVEV